jgi:4-amino-4-deoxy-L-arabinose transferase-like glycosyltransferase
MTASPPLPDTLDAPALAPALDPTDRADAPARLARLGAALATALTGWRRAAGPAGLAARRAAQNTDAVIATVLALATGAVHAIGVFGFPSLADDEGTYAAQAAAVRGGELAHYTYWYDHPPLGWIQMALLDWLPQRLFPAAHPVAASRLVMVLASTAGAALLYLLARRIGLGRAFAALAVVLAFVSPLAVVLQRQVYLDNVATPWVLLSLVLALDPRRRLAMHLAAGAAFAIAVLTKETSVLLLPVAALVLLRSTDARTRPFSIAGWLSGVALIVFYPLTAVLRGELVPGRGHVSLWDAVMFQIVDRSGTGAMWDPNSLSRLALDSWLTYDSWIVIFGLAAAPVCLAVRALRPVGLAVALLTLVALKPSGYLPVMYVIVALPFLGLAAAGAAEVLWHLAHRLAVRAVPQLRSTRGVVVQARRVLVGAAALAVAGGLAWVWTPTLHSVLTTPANNFRYDAEAWVAANVPASSVVLADDVTWVALVDDHVVPRSRALWFYKLDTDPAVRAELPGGWRDVDYVVATDQLRNAIAGDPTLREAASALKESDLVAVFGDGDGRVEIRRVNR